MLAFYCSLSSVHKVKDVVEIPSNFKLSFYRTLCCYDGLYLMYCDRTHLLWNPSTRESILLPGASFPSSGGCFRYGLGYDSTSDDYKILMLGMKSYSNGSYSKILALKSGSWREIAKHPRGFCNVNNMESLAFLNGAFHWVGEDISSKYQCVVSFNLSNEVYREMSLPELTCNMPFIFRGVAVMGESLYTYYSCRTNDSLEGPTTFKLWVMNDYGVAKSWTEIYSIHDTSLLYVIPKYMFADGDVLLFAADKKSYGCDGFRTSKELAKLWHASSRPHQGFVCIESLISPKLL